ncbi:hypothetical protein [Actinomadura rudentiformis]|uniref:Uncharacterized protein n=1 Tax=Actinomadura rudentiformis TaxID=359158 RepID=A0A6H9YM95_9ACTN|nr:hypothetical protein [Actinomadura rudentiformis]KAB2346920.1 hypothetical protein F8566_22255 [Actinomadura rudentiformis]
MMVTSSSSWSATGSGSVSENIVATVTLEVIVIISVHTSRIWPSRQEPVTSVIRAVMAHA